MDAKAVGDATLHGWRDALARRVGERAPIADDVVRAALGLVFFALSLRYVVESLRAVARELRN
jgi:hypothetical protein